ncbi:MAG: cytochrome c biogenesis protein CcsA [Acidimicrobiales bacterium]
MLGQVLLVLASGAALAAGLAAIPSRLGLATSRRLLGLAVLSIWGAVAVLASAIMRLDTSYAYVAEQTRADMARPLRFSALWSGAEGSLLLFAALLATALLIGNRSGPRWQLAGSGLLVSGFAVTSFRGANPFQRLDLPPLSGAGMAPILEHFAMVIHPPLLYTGMCLALVPALVRDDRSGNHAAHRWSLAAMAVLTVALGFGSAWAYVELGWGGWWAWDPIENIALIVWLLLAASLHWRPLDPEQQAGSGPLNAVAIWALCWPAVIGGAALTRTSLRTSVHAFADAAQLSVWLWPLAALAALGAAIRVAEQYRGPSKGRVHNRDLLDRGPQAILVAAGLIVAAGSYRPFIGGDGTAGWFYSQTLYPVAIVGAILIGVVPLRRPSDGLGEGWPIKAMVRFGAPGAITFGVIAALAGWRAWFQLLLAAAIGFGVALVLSSGRRNIARLAGHLGVLFVLFGALAGTVSTNSVARLNVGESAVVDGHTVEVLSAAITSQQPLQVEVRLLIDGAYELRPSVAVYPERNLRLPEVSTRTRPWLDSQAVLRDFDADAGALVTVLFRPWNQLVWWGVALLTLSATLAAFSHRKPAPAEQASHDVGADGSQSAAVSLGLE